MGEIDTKPIESVQTAITFFGQSNEQRRNSSPTNDKFDLLCFCKKQEMETERELASVRLQLAAHNQALLKLDHYQKAAEELSTLLKNSDRKKNFYINQSQEAISALDKETAEETERVKMELERSREQENEGQVEIALLKFQVHKGRSRLAAAEARAQSEKTALYNALQQMGLEAEETKRENRMLKEAAKLEEEKEMVVVVRGEREELESVKRELEVAVAKIGEVRARAEQAASRAEAAERELEEQKRKRREHKERRKAALAALRSELDRKSSTVKEEDLKIYQPLGKVLNMKF